MNDTLCPFCNQPVNAHGEDAPTITIAFTADLAELFGDVCDAAARPLYGIPDDDPFGHTSSMAREIAGRVLDVLARHSQQPPMRPRTCSHPRAFIEQFIEQHT